MPEMRGEKLRISVCRRFMVVVTMFLLKMKITCVGVCYCERTSNLTIFNTYVEQHQVLGKLKKKTQQNHRKLSESCSVFTF